MNIIKVECLPLSIFVGYERENDARGVAFDYSAWTEQYGDGVLQLLVQRPGDADPYPVVLTAGEDGTAVWSPSATDTAAKGWVEIQLIFMVGSVVVKTAVLQALVDRSLTAGSTPPDPYETWLETLTELAKQILHTTQPPEIRDGYWYIFDPDTGEYVNSGVKAEGEDGVGITGAQLNADYTLTLNFSDGTSYTTPSIRGAQGEVGPTPQLSVGTVTTGAAGSNAAVEISGTPEAPVLNFTIPRGDTGEVSEAELQAALLEKADVITDTASGAIASFPDGMAAPVKALTVAVEPVQDLHGYDAPWPAGGGKNLLNANLSESITGNKVFNFGTPLSVGTYTFSFQSADTTGQVASYQLGVYKDTTAAYGYYAVSPNIKTQSFTISEPCSKIVLYSNKAYNQSQGFTTVFSKLMIEAGSFATSFAPFSNDCPISGWAAANLQRASVNIWDEEWEVGGLNITTGQDNTLTDRIRSKNYIPVKPNTEYRYVNGSINLVVLYYDINKNYLGEYYYMNVNQALKMTSANCYYLRFYMVGAYGTTYNHDISINYPSTDADYHAYNGVSFIIALGQTVYGAHLDVVNGKMVVGMAITTTLNNLSWEYRTGEYAYSYFVSSLNDKKAGSIKMLCSQYKTATGGRNTLTSDCMIAPYNISNSKGVCIRDDAYSDATIFANSLAGVQLVYELATPFELTLTPEEIEALKGTNNFWSDAGDVSVEYRADTKLYIEKKITAAIAAALNS